MGYQVCFPSMLCAIEHHVALQLCLNVLSCCQTEGWCQEHLVYFTCIPCQRVIMCPAADAEDAVSDVSPKAPDTNSVITQYQH